MFHDALVSFAERRAIFMEVLQAKNLKKIYGSGNNAVHALDGVDLRDVYKRQILPCAVTMDFT